jgi:hypothetical protein
MAFPSKSTVDALKREWSDRLVRVKPGLRPELLRFEGKVGKVITVNYGGRAIVDFADGAWYDIPDFATVLEEVTDEAERKKYDSTANSAQRFPARQG